MLDSPFGNFTSLRGIIVQWRILGLNSQVIDKKFLVQGDLTDISSKWGDLMLERRLL